MKPPQKSRWSKAGRAGWVIFLLLIIAFGYIRLRSIYTVATPPPSPKSSPMPALGDKSIHDFLSGVSLQTATGNVTDPFPVGKIYLLEFYFYRCPPCRAKHPALQEIDAMMKDSDVEIIYIDNGKIDDVADFHYRVSKTEKQYYDSAALLIKQLQIKSFPFEMIIDKKGMIRYVSKGYNKDKKEEYIRKTIARITSLQ
jgi:thiol-disulfide isomerase/thioredoxin